MSERHMVKRWYEQARTTTASYRRTMTSPHSIVWGLLALVLAGGALSLAHKNIVVRSGVEGVVSREMPSPEEFAGSFGSQRCTVEPFSVSVDSGGTGEQEVMMQPPFSGTSFRLLAGDLPAGVDIRFDPAEGMFGSRAQARYLIARHARPGSYTVLIVYRARDAKGGTTSVACQSNLIIRP